MRLCLNDANLAVSRDLKIENAKRVYDIGFRVAGVELLSFDVTDADIDHVKDVLAKAGLEMGPLGVGYAAIHPDKKTEQEYLKKLIRALEIGGKLGCTNIRISAGSMHPNVVWLNHPENHTQKALDRLIENTKTLVPYAEKYRCSIGLETTSWTIVNSVTRMQEYSDRIDSPYNTVIFDFVNHMTCDNIYESGAFARCAIATLGDRIGEFHVKDVKVDPEKLLVSHIDETDLGTGLIDHETVIKISTQLEPWKTFSLEHFRNTDLWKPGYDYIQSIANKIGHKWSDPKCTRDAWLSGKNKG
jgi:sugar phosphate isomerase/epimerase